MVEAKAVWIDDSAWAPLFSTVVEPNHFTANVEQIKQSESPVASLDDFWEQFESQATVDAAKKVVATWIEAGHRTRLRGDGRRRADRRIGADRGVAGPIVTGWLPGDAATPGSGLPAHTRSVLTASPSTATTDP